MLETASPLISVVIPVYNGSATIRETVESVLSQTHRNLELIVIDDGSTDDTSDVLASIADPRVHVFSLENAGIATSRNRGLARCRGQFVSFIDADDLWTPDKLQAQLEALQQAPGAGAAYSWTDYVDENGAFLHQGSHVSLSGDIYAAMLVQNFLENGSNALIRRAVFDSVGDFDESVPKGAEDWEFFIRVARHYTFVPVRKAQVLYRVATNSVSANIHRQECALVEVVNRAFASAPVKLQPLRKRSLANLYGYLMFRALDSSTDRGRSLTALRCMRKSLASDPRLLLSRPTAMTVAIAKMLMAALLPKKGVRTILSAARRILRRPQLA
ncbi:MAG: glycosyltransferase [Bryobacteraceae bacterium]